MGSKREEHHVEVERVYRRDGAKLQRAVLLYAGDREVASDAVAEAFAQALRREGSLRDPGAWVWRAAFRIAAGELKDRSRRAQPAPPLSLENASPRDYHVPNGTRDLMDALGRLSPMQRASVVLHYLGGYRAREVAPIIGSTTSAVMVHLSQGRKRLHDLLEVRDEQD